MKFPPNREGQTYRKNPSSTAPRMSSDDDRIRNELMTGKRTTATAAPADGADQAASSSVGGKGASVYRSIKGADAMSKPMNTALNRKLKLDDALGTFRSAGGRKK
jgi:hypothetical protein